MSTNQPPPLTPPSPKVIGVIVAGLIILMGIFSSYYTINPEEAAVVMRFGRYIKTTEPGLHFKLPLGIDRIIKIQLTTIRKSEFGFRTINAGVSSSFSREGYNYESTMLTGDLNVADVTWIVQYRVNDPYKFVFNVKNVDKTIRDISESIMRLVVGDNSVTNVLTTGRTTIAADVKERIQVIFDHYKLGIKVTNVILRDVNPPTSVKPSFNMVNEAKQDQDRLINEGWKEYNKRVPIAKGRAKNIVQQAEGYALERVNQAKGESHRFLEIYKAYAEDPALTKKRLYLENIAAIFQQTKKLLIADPEVKTIVPYLKLNPGIIESK